MSNQSKEQITAALKQLGPSNCTEIAGELGAEPSAVSYHLKLMLAAETLKASANRHLRVYALPEQKIDGAPTPPPGQAHVEEEEGQRRRQKEKQAGATRPARHRQRWRVHSGDRRRLPARLRERHGGAGRVLDRAHRAHRDPPPSTLQGLTP